MASVVRDVLDYMALCGGMDEYEFVDGRGQPDPAAARVFAEQVRLNERVHIDNEALAVVQRVNRVRLVVPAAVEVTPEWERSPVADY